jgi:hypothetical protein
MYLNIEVDGSVTLEEANDFGQFEIRSSIDLASGHLSDEFFSFAKPTDDGRYWIDAEVVVGLSSKSNDSKWCTAFWTMLEKAEPYGFADIARKRIKSHVAK